MHPSETTCWPFSELEFVSSFMLSLAVVTIGTATVFAAVVMATVCDTVIELAAVVVTQSPRVNWELLLSVKGHELAVFEARSN